MRVVCLLFPKGAPVLEIAEACYRWTPQIAVRPEEAVFLEIEKCHRLFKEQSLLGQLQVLLKRFQVSARIAVADDVFTSLAWARFSTKTPVFVKNKKDNNHLPLEALCDIASPFEYNDELTRHTFIMITELKRLGLKNLGDFLKLSPKDLASRFQRQSLSLYRRSQKGDLEESLALWPAFELPERISEAKDLDDFIYSQTLEPFLFLFKGLLDRVVSRLAGRGERLSKVRLRFDLEKHSFVKDSLREWIFEFPQSLGSVAGITAVFKERLNYDLSVRPLASAVTRVEIEVLEKVPGQYFQRNFFNKKEEEEEAWNSLISRLCEKLGRQCTPAFVAEPQESYKPEKAWKRTIRERPETSGAVVDLPLPERPLRLIPKPQPLQKVGNNLMTTENSLKWEITDWEGPERISGEWWGEELKRDYFRIGTKTGEHLWIFRIPDSGQIYLHGYFD